ncbi:MAG: hypothetical protein JXR94_10720, partial [Candidatus Hydrogenedentes bacterium]|nr:hypothetical protein [Candidatus Hydrogenedentota bacterium]
STFLVRSLRFGLIGAGLNFGWWLWVTYIGERLARRMRGTGFGRVALGIAVVTPICIAISVIDAALDLHIILTATSLLAMDTVFRAEQRRVRPVGVRPIRDTGTASTASVTSGLSGRDRRAAARGHR